MTIAISGECQCIVLLQHGMYTYRLWFAALREFALSLARCRLLRFSGLFINDAD
jgi:hypothetical protein